MDSSLLTVVSAFYIAVLFVTVTNFKGSGCQRRLTSPVGYLASLPLYDANLSTGCQVSNQWTIEGAAGQRVNLTLLDFSLQTSFEVSRSSKDFCKQFPYAILSDANSNLGGRSVPVCSGRGSTSHVFLSTGSVITVQFNEMLITSRLINFILKYEGQHFIIITVWMRIHPTFITLIRGRPWLIGGPRQNQILATPLTRTL